MKVFNFKRSLHKNLLDLWSWEVLIWTQDRFMADLVLKSTRYFGEEKDASDDMNSMIEKFGIEK